MLSNLSRRCLKKLKTPHIRSFLSEAYKLTDTWNSRLSSPILQKVNLETFYYEIEQKYNNKNAASAIDIDIFVNKVTDDNHFDEIADLLNKLRRTAEATNILDSTGHAFTRNLLTYNQIEMLIQVLDNRVEYGVILDDYAVNLALDTLIKAGKMKEAARIATIHLMQEDFTNPITRILSLYSCFKFLENPEHFDDLKPPEKPVIAPGTKKPKIEEIKVRVGFLRNPYFDDHFDLRDSQHLVGKTLYYIGKELQSGDLCTNVKLLGLVFYQKYEKASKLLESTKGSQVYKIVVDKIHDALSKVSEEQQNSEGFNAFKISMEQIAQSHKIVEFDLGNHIEELCKKTVAELEGQEIEQQKKLYGAWMEIREKRLKEEIERLRRAERIKHVEKLTKDMEAEEQKLWFFENEDKIDLQIENKRVFYPKRWFGKKKKPRQLDEDYIPPEIKVEYKK